MRWTMQNNAGNRTAMWLWDLTRLCLTFVLIKNVVNCMFKAQIQCQFFSFEGCSMSHWRSSKYWFTFFSKYFAIYNNSWYNMTRMDIHSEERTELKWWLELYKVVNFYYLRFQFLLNAATPKQNTSRGTAVPGVQTTARGVLGVSRKVSSEFV